MLARFLALLIGCLLLAWILVIGRLWAKHRGGL